MISMADTTTEHTEPTTAADALLKVLDHLIGPDQTKAIADRHRQADVILTSAVTHALTSIRRGRPGYARFQLEAARLRAQRVLDGTVPPVVEIGGSR